MLFTKEVDSISINQTIDLSMSLSGDNLLSIRDDLVSILGADKKSQSKYSARKRRRRFTFGN